MRSELLVASFSCFHELQCTGQQVTLDDKLSFLPRCSMQGGISDRVGVRLSVCPSVRLSVRPSQRELLSLIHI